MEGKIGDFMLANINTISNFNDDNIKIVRSYYENRLKAKKKEPVFTMEQSNAPANVSITNKSREVCADYLTVL